MINMVISEEEVRNVLEKLKINKSQGPDGMHPHFLRETAEELVHPLSIIFRKSSRREAKS